MVKDFFEHETPEHTYGLEKSDWGEHPSREHAPDRGQEVPEEVTDRRIKSRG